MSITDQGSTRPVSDDPFRFQPYYREDFVEAGVVSETKGTDLMLGLLLDQYQKKPNLLAYFAAFFEEMDYLFKEIDEVYLGRFLERAVGKQLDILGVIIGIGREISVQSTPFGFVGAPVAHAGMADRATPEDGGIFSDLGYIGYTSVPLGDEQYRKILMAKSQLHNRHAISVNQLYQATITVLGKVPRVLEISVTGPRLVTLSISTGDTSESDRQLVSHLTQYHTPLGTTLTVTPVA